MNINSSICCNSRRSRYWNKTNEVVIDNFFGFAFGTIIPPSESVLKNLFIQKRDERGEISCPREPFNGLFFSEEIKYALSMGYKFNMVWGFKFERGKNIFKNCYYCFK